MHVNLLPREFVTGKRVRRARTTWLIVLTAAVIAGLGLCTAKYTELASLKRKMADDDATVADREQVMREIALWQRDLQKAKEGVAAMKRLRADKTVLTLIGVIARSARLAHGKLQLLHTNIAMPQAHAAAVMVTDPGTGVQTEIQQRGAVTCEGLAEDAATISRLMAGLREAGVFTQVDLKGSSEMLSNAVKSRHFQIDCQF